MKLFRPLAGLLVLIARLAQAQSAGAPSVNIAQLMDSVALRLRQHYVFPAEAQRMGEYVQTQARKNAYAAWTTEPQRLGKQLQADLQAIHRDPHLFVEYNPALATTSRVSPQPTAAELAQAKKYWLANNYLFKKVEVLPGNIGYLPFTGFVPDLAGAQPTIDAALRFVANTQALVIDLRDNMGGSPELVTLLESYFFKTKTHVNDLINRSTNDTTVCYADPAKVPFTLSMPLYILTSRNTFSGAEDFAYALQMANRATVVGETTGGGAHPTRPVSVGQGFVVSIPYARSLNPVTHTDWEGTGVVPTVKVAAPQALVTARQLALRARRQAAADEQEKRQLDYLLDELAAQQRPATALPVSSLQAYPGTYGPLTIYAANNKLFCRNVEANNLITELRPIAPNRFVLDDNAHVEFVQNNRGSCPLIRLYVSDGNVFEERRKEPR